MRRLSGWLGLMLAVSGCSFTLNTSIDGLTCGSDGDCLPGYVCSATNTCVLSSQGGCSPACSALEECDRGQCAPICQGRACPAGEACANGVCTAVTAASAVTGTAQLGATCTSDSECTGQSPAGASLFCLIPYGGHSDGFCSADCNTSQNCGGLAPACLNYASEASDGVSLCAGTSFLACQTDADCAPSGLVCGVYETGSSVGANRSIEACRLPIPSGQTAGLTCNAGTSPCENGLCVPTSTRGNPVCTEACSQDSDCGAFNVASGVTPASCSPVTIGGIIDYAAYPTVRAMLCVPGGSSLGATCSPTSGAQCSADAPNCIASPSLDGGTEMSHCVPQCTDDTVSISTQCPTGYQCSVPSLDGGVDAGTYCAVQ